ncbi:MAG TPA: flagellar biosynthesis anti-sigma factor FlgM [Thermoanaerobacterales bacterium]|nr:flagellar biosynthesis anti-sigma factor FlgM [Thermoanaerobacterales bacterium]
MNISRSQLDGIIRTYLKNSGHVKTKSTKKAPEECTDEVSLSEDVQEFARAVKLVSKADDVRIEKVEELKAEINTGTYNIDGKLVADKIIGEYLADKLI